MTDYRALCGTAGAAAPVRIAATAGRQHPPGMTDTACSRDPLRQPCTPAARSSPTSPGDARPLAGHLQAAELRLARIVGRARRPVLAAQLRDHRTRLCLLHDADESGRARPEYRPSEKISGLAGPLPRSRAATSQTISQWSPKSTSCTLAQSIQATHPAIMGCPLMGAGFQWRPAALSHSGSVN